jgi:glutathione S-transferase
VTPPLELHYHPLSSYCMKALVALYENDTPFEPRLLDLANEAARAAFIKVWPIGKMPVLRDRARDRVVVESSIIIEYLAQHYPGRTELVPADPDLSREARMRDRFYDLYVMTPMQKIVTDGLRPAGKRDPHGVEQADTTLVTAYGMIEAQLATKPSTWAMGEAFTIADCAAAPSLFYAGKVVAFGDAHPAVAAYLARLTERPSFARVLAEAEPYFASFPGRSS